MTNIMRTFTFILLLILSSLFVQASIHVVGIVTDKNDKQPLPGVTVQVKGERSGTITDLNGRYQIEVPSPESVLVYSFIGFKRIEIKNEGKTKIDVALEVDQVSVQEVVVIGYGIQKKQDLTGACTSVSNSNIPIQNTESYSSIPENGYKKAVNDAFSTFSVDVDVASYANVRRYLNGGELPPKDAVRIEEMINYFAYDYKQPSGNYPISVDFQLTECPWNKDNKLLHIGVQGKIVSPAKLPASNLVFLIDVSGSMNEPNKLPLLKSSFKLLVEQLRPIDKVAIVVYAGNSGLVLPSTSGDKKSEILKAIDNLEAGGSTAGAAGLALAYKTAEENLLPKGNNRIVLATDGDFNVGQSSNAEMEKMIEGYRSKNIYISVLGFGMGNYKDDKMEIIADKGNGNYAYIDNLQEAKKTLVSQFAGTMFTIAKDVKIQLEFNPGVVDSFRLIGYENRVMNKEDFENDKKDAGEIGSGHSVTALYEIVTAKKGAVLKANSKYQNITLKEGAKSLNELGCVSLRYKDPRSDKSQLIEFRIKNEPVLLKDANNNLKFSASVAAMGMKLKKSEFIKDFSFDQIIQLANESKANDKDGYKAEFIKLAETAKGLDKANN